MGSGTDEVLKDLLGLQEKLYRLFDEQANRDPDRAKSVSARWVPPVDICETEGSYVLLAEIPGVPLDEIDLEVREDLLVLRGERPSITDEDGTSYHRVERPHGMFQRVFRLPPGADTERVRAGYRDGVLQVTVPKGLDRKSRSVTVCVEP